MGYDAEHDNPLDTVWAWEESGPLGKFVQPIDRVGRLRELIACAQGELEAEVRNARTAGASWAEVGTALDVSRQAAHERFAS